MHSVPLLHQSEGVVESVFLNARLLLGMQSLFKKRLALLKLSWSQSKNLLQNNTFRSHIDDKFKVMENIMEQSSTE